MTETLARKYFAAAKAAKVPKLARILARLQAGQSIAESFAPEIAPNKSS
jgi:hypothetical protein